MKSLLVSMSTTSSATFLRRIGLMRHNGLHDQCRVYQQVALEDASFWMVGKNHCRLYALSEGQPVAAELADHAHG